MLQRYVIFRLLLIIVVSGYLYACSSDNPRTDHARSQQSNTPSPQQFISGNDSPIDSNAIIGAWIGEMYDVRGYGVILQLNLTNTKGMLSGEMTVTVSDEEHSDMYKSLVNGSISNDSVTIGHGDVNDIDRKPFMTGKLSRSKPFKYGDGLVHYRYKMYGTYDSVPGIPDLEGGVWMVRPGTASPNMQRHD